MKFEVMSRNNARSISFDNSIEDCIIISITDVGSEPNHFNNNSHIKAVLNVQFNDVEFNENGCISDAQANEIISFVNDNINNVNKIIVHCEAGISRSAGVCAALMKIINDDDSPIFDNPRFCPNMSCYRAIMEAYFGSYDEDIANEKIAHNIKIWKEINLD